MAESGKIDPMHQFTIEPLFGTDHLALGGYNIAFTNSALWMSLAAGALFLFVLLGMKRELVPGRWQMAVEFFTGFIDNLLMTSVGPAGKTYLPYVFSLFMFILFANILGMIPLGLVGSHAFTFTSHFTATGFLSILSFSIVLIVGFWKHKLHFFSLFVPHGTPLLMIPFIFLVELLSFMVRPVQPWPSTVRGDDGWSHSAGSVVRIRDQQRQCRPWLGIGYWHSKFSSDGRHQRA